MATYTRQNVYEAGGDWAEPILWYARGVAVMQSRKLGDRLAWRFYGGIHGFDEPIWQDLGYFSASDTMPSQADFDQFWKQCQHGSWYFLPWHRGYLLAFEAIIRAAVVGLGGPSSWALPYWNYFKANQFQLPPAFASPDWPDGKGNNPLFVQARYGPNNDGNVYVPLADVNLDAMGVADYTGVPRGDRGFGGVDTGFEHGGRFHGDLEQQPHDQVHGLVGGGDVSTNLPGLMSDPDTAGLDPIFWLHHANIDRLWEVWIQSPVSLGNPTDPNWVGGPATVGERPFSMPMPPSGTPWSYTPGDMADLSKLDYTYDDLSPMAPAAPVAARLQRLGIAPAAATLEVAAMSTTNKTVELVGSSQQPLKISGSQPVRSTVHLDQTARRKVSASFAAAAAQNATASADVSEGVAETAAPDRVFLNLEDVRGLNDATAFRVYVNLPEGASPADHPERLAGTITLFGVRKATAADGDHGGQGLTFVLEITKIVDELHLNDALDVDKLDVRIVPINPVPEEAKVSIGSISIFRQGA
ncbi:MAG: tyrosinase [Acidobacteria bacterium]|nr:tyrosinase [Acidobacteriota bacterium]